MLDEGPRSPSRLRCWAVFFLDAEKAGVATAGVQMDISLIEGIFRIGIAIAIPNVGGGAVIAENAQEDRIAEEIPPPHIQHTAIRICFAKLSNRCVRLHIGVARGVHRSE